MGGPIVRTGTNPAYWANWDQAFGKAAAADKKSAGKSKSVKKAAKPAKAAGKGAKKAQKKKK